MALLVGNAAADAGTFAVQGPSGCQTLSAPLTIGGVQWSESLLNSLIAKNGGPVQIWNLPNQFGNVPPGVYIITGAIPTAALIADGATLLAIVGQGQCAAPPAPPGPSNVFLCNTHWPSDANMLL